MQMKRKILATLLIGCPAAAYADTDGLMLTNGIYIPTIIIRTSMILLLFWGVGGFLLAIVRVLLNYRLKSKMISMGIVGDEAEKMLQSGIVAKDQAMKWFFLLLFAGIAFMIIGCLPFGWFSVGILAFSLALAFACYYFYLNKRK